jgi:hypothetical protein
MIILPSSEANFFDTAQYHSKGSGINASYPNPSGADKKMSGAYKPSGIYVTYSSSASSGDVAVFSSNELDTAFSNAEFIINNFQSFNEYIHYYPRKIDDLDNITPDNMNRDKSLQIPYVSSFRVNAFVFNPYGVLNV